MAHIMFITYALQGHINPMVQFSKRLVSKGIKVTIVTTATIQISTNSINIEHISVDQPSSQGDTNEIIEEGLSLFKIGVLRNLPEIIEKQKSNGSPVKILVYDALMPWVMDICMLCGIQGVAFCTHSCAVFAIFYHVYKGSLEVDCLGESDIVSLPSLPLLNVKDLPSFVYDLDSYQCLFRLFMSQFPAIEKANCVLFNSINKLESEVSNFFYVVCVEAGNKMKSKVLIPTNKR